MQNPQLSIIIPCYNCEETLEEAVASIFSQKMTSSFEIVMVDDGSTDNTRKKMTELAEKYKNVRLFYHVKNQGGGATRNTAVKNAEGELIFCLDSDDMLGPDTLQRLVDYQREKQCDGVGVSTSIKFKGRNVKDVAFINNFSYVGEKIPLESLLEKNEICCPLYSTFLITKEAFNRIGGYPTEHGFDTQGIAWRFLAQGLTAYTCPDTTYLHRVEFHRSYYLRESDAGKVNYNWQDIFFENFFLFNKEAQEFIRSFNCKDFSSNIFNELKKRDPVFKEDYSHLLGNANVHERPEPTKRVYIKRKSVRGIILRLKERLKQIWQ